MGENIRVSVCCITYNHAPYIRQCLDGFLMQKTDFKYEVLIHDDASTDGTEEIIREYEAKYPDIIKPLYEKENQWVLGRRGSKTFNYPRAKGKYIALCEGDDYWIDPYKLQKQVDFLEKNPEYSMCFHNAIEHWEDGLIADRVFSNVENRDYSAFEIYKKWTIPTASVLFKKLVIQSDFYLKKVTLNKNFIFGDIVLFLTCALYGKMRGLINVMSVYRRHEKGISIYFDKYKKYKFCLHNYAIGEVFVYDEKISILSKKNTLRIALPNFFKTFFNDQLRIKYWKIIKKYTLVDFFYTLYALILEIIKKSPNN